MSYPQNFKEPPKGYRFRPPDSFLINVLEHKAQDRTFDVLSTTEYGDLLEVEMYGNGKEPWNLFSGHLEIRELRNSNDPTQKILERYVVTELNRSGKNNCKRIAGQGAWNDKGTTKPVLNVRGEEVGYWSNGFTYVYTGGDGAADGMPYYLMNELHLTSMPTDFVLCKVMKNVSKSCQVRAPKKRRQQECCPAPAAKKPRRGGASTSYCCQEASTSAVAPPVPPVVLLENDSYCRQEASTSSVAPPVPPILQLKGGWELDELVFTFEEFENPVVEEICAYEDPVAAHSTINIPPYVDFSDMYLPDMSAVRQQNQELQQHSEQLVLEIPSSDWDSDQIFELDDPV